MNEHPLNNPCRLTTLSLPLAGGVNPRIHGHPDLQEPRKHDIPLLLVLVAELLAISPLLPLGPHAHVVAPDNQRQGERPAPGSHDGADPANHLEHVVGARDDGEADARGDLPLGAATGPQAGEVHVDGGVADLAEDEDGEADHVDEGLVGGGGERGGRVEGVGGEDAPEGPVEERVADDVPGGHGRGGELVHEDGLELALGEVRDDHGEGEALGLRERARGHGRPRVDVGAERENQGVDEEGAEVLDDEDRPPRDLDAYGGFCVSNGVDRGV